MNDINLVLVEDERNLKSFVRFVFKHFDEVHGDIAVCSFCGLESAYWAHMQCPRSVNRRHGYLSVRYDNFKDPEERMPVVEGG